MREELRALEMELPEFTAVLDGNDAEHAHLAYPCMITQSVRYSSRMLRAIAADNACLQRRRRQASIRRARPKFEELQTEPVLA